VAAAGSKRWVARSLMAVTGVVALFGLTKLGVGSNPAEFFPAGHPFRAGFERLLAHFGGDGFLFVDVSAPEGKTIFDPAFLERVAAFQRDAAGVPGIAWASSVADRVIMRSHRVMNGDDPAYERVPETAALASAYTEVFRWSAPETLSEMTEDVDSPKRLVIDVFADVNDSAQIAEMVASLRALAAKHFPTENEGRAIFGGEWVLWIAQQHYIVVGKIWNVISSVPMVGLVCLWQLRSLSGAVLSVLPAGFAALMVLGLMGIIGIRLDLASGVITAIVIGVGADFAIHFILRHREVTAEAGPAADPQRIREESVRLSAPPILNDAYSNIISFAVCAASPLVPVREFGYLICLSMFASATSALALLPGLLGTGRSAEIGDSASVADDEQVGGGGLVLPNLEVAERRSDG
jgi:predicted RND superfamily exporter protein